MITIKDIAKMAGVSTATVSMALNGKKGIGDQKRAQILEIVKNTGYIPNPNARKLITDSTNNIAILLRQDMRSIGRLFYMELTNSVLAAGRDRGYNLIFCAYGVDSESEVLPDIIRVKDVAGVLVFGDIQRSVLAAMRRLNLPVVLLDTSRDYDDCLVVSMDYREAARTATAYLLELGHRDIAYIGNNRWFEFNMHTFNGFQQVLAEYSVKLSINRIQFDAYDIASLEACVDRALEGSMPTAIFCTTDIYAAYTMQHLMSKGVRIPEDISIIGIDDAVISSFTMPRLTTVRVDWEKMGQYGYELLMSAVNGEACEDHILPSNTLILRESTAAPRQH